MCLSWRFIPSNLNNQTQSANIQGEIRINYIFWVSGFTLILRFTQFTWIWPRLAWITLSLVIIAKSRVCAYSSCDCLLYHFLMLSFQAVVMQLGIFFDLFYNKKSDVSRLIHKPYFCALWSTTSVMGTRSLRYFLWRALYRPLARISDSEENIIKQRQRLTLSIRRGRWGHCVL
jgi:hypothetical protein